MIEIVEYKDEYAEDVSALIIRDLLEINSKDYGIEEMKKHAEKFKVDNLREEFKKREMVYVALDNKEVVGTAGIAKSWHNPDGEYWILSVFIKPEYHKRGIGTLLIHKVEEYAINTIKAKTIIIPASKTACEFYEKMGYKYKNGLKELNKNNMYIMEKKII